MARPLRIEFENAFYHVMNRGTERRAIFVSDKHREMFLRLLDESVVMFGIEIHAYCLMGNHYHLLIRTPGANLSRAMRHIDGVYTQRFNRAERRDGSLFRGRYKSIVIDEDAYLVAVSRYIHRNPLEAKVVKRLMNYQWSSYQAYLDEASKPNWVTTSEVMHRMGLQSGASAQSYRTFVEDPKVASLSEYYNSKRVSPVLGAKAFRNLVVSRSLRRNDPEIPHSRILLKPKSLEAIINEIAALFSTSREELMRSQRGQTNLPRAIAMYFARRECGHRLRDIANAFGCASYSVVGSAVHNLEKQMQDESGLQEKVEMLTARLHNK